MASVSAVSSTDFRVSLSQPQNSAAEGDDPFSLLLNAVADVKAGVREPDAPKAERRDDVPAKQPKPEADADRQAKRRTPDAEKPEAKPQTEASDPAKSADESGEETETDDSGDYTASADALLMIALTETEQQTAVGTQASTDPNVAQIAAAPAIAATAQVTTATQTAPALAAAIADVTVPAAAEAQPVQTSQQPAKIDVQLEIAPASGNGKTRELSLPEAAVEAILSHTKPENAAAQFKLEGRAQVQTQPGSVNVATARALQGPAHLEMLNAAINKQVQLSLGLEANEAAPELPKPQVSSNAVAPNFAMTVQINAPVQAQTMMAAEVSRAVPLNELAVEIATRAGKGERRFDIRLDPPELGRIDVRLEIDSKGNTTTKLIVERAETLDMLQRDARGLEKALQNAGLKLDAGGLEFSLRQDTQAQHGQQGHAPEPRGLPDLAEADTEIMTEIAAGNATLAAQIRGGVDIRI